MLRRVLRIVSLIALIALVVGVLVEGKGTLASRAGVVLVWVIVALLAPFARNKLGLPKQRPDEAYVKSLDRWRRSRP